MPAYSLLTDAHFSTFVRREAWLAAYAPRRFPIRQWRRFLTEDSPFTLVDVVHTGVVDNVSLTFALLKVIGKGIEINLSWCKNILCNNVN